MPYTVKVEYADARKMRTRNKPWYRAAHWPIWIWVFFLAPGPLTFNLFAHGGSVGNLIWLGAVLIGTGIAAFCGQLPGAEPAPYILRFTEDRPNPLYRRVCYTFAWNALLNFALLNLAGHDAYEIVKAQPRKGKRIFPASLKTIGTYWTRAVAELDMGDLHFNDIRHEAISRLVESDYRIEQVSVVSGHRDWSMLKRYTHLRTVDLHRSPTAELR